MNHYVEDAIACPKCGTLFVPAKEAAGNIGDSYSRVRAIRAHSPERLQAFRVGSTWLTPEYAAREFHPLPPHRPRIIGDETCR